MLGRRHFPAHYKNIRDGLPPFQANLPDLLFVLLGRYRLKSANNDRPPAGQGFFPKQKNRFYTMASTESAGAYF